MFGKFGDMIAMQRKMKALQKALEDEVVEVEVDGGALVASVNGQGDLVDFVAEDAVWADRDRLKKLLFKALKKGKEIAQKMMAEKMKSAGIGLPGMG